MKQIKKHHAQWALGASATLASLGSAQAAVVRVDLGHDLTTTLDNVVFHPDLGVDAGQWKSAYRNAATLYFSFFNHDGARKLSFSVNNFSLAAGSRTIGVRNFRADLSVNVSGLIAWNLADGTEGWLHVTSSNVGISSIVADYFAFNDAFIGATGGRGSADLMHGGNSEAFAGATVFTGTASVPEPSSLALLALGAAGILSRRRRAAA